MEVWQQGEEQGAAGTRLKICDFLGQEYLSDISLLVVGPPGPVFKDI